MTRLGAHTRAVHDCFAAVQLIRVVQLGHALRSAVITAVDDPPASRVHIRAFRQVALAWQRFRLCLVPSPTPSGPCQAPYL